VPSGTLTQTPLNRKKSEDVYPASNILFSQILDQEIYQIWEKKIRELYCAPSTEELRVYQNLGIQKILTRDSIGIFDQQRLGKTPMVLSSLKYRTDIYKVIIVVPKSLIISWYQECCKWYTTDCVAVRGPKAQRARAYQKNAKVEVLSYGTLVQDWEHFSGMSYNCIIVDEAHRLRNFKGQRSKNSPLFTKLLLSFSYQAKYKYALTGTPAPNKPDNIYPILHMLYPTLFTSYYNFVDYYFEVHEKYISRTDTVQEIGDFKPQKQQELQEFLDIISLQRKRKDYMQWLPPVDIKEIHLSFDQKEKKWYNDIATTFECEELNVSCPNLLSQMTALRKLAVTSKAKLEYIKEYVADYPEEKIIIVSEFSSYLKEIQKEFPNSQIITGDTSAIRRKELEQQFNNGDFNILFANIQAIKEGMKFEQCHTMIIIDPSLVYTDNEQLEDRLLPTSIEVAEQKEKQQIIRLIIDESIDTYIQLQLQKKATKTEIINDFRKSLALTK
jgi:superfamily II DNA or RNA helicase